MLFALVSILGSLAAPADSRLHDPPILVPEGMELVDAAPPESVPAQPAGPAREAGWAWRVREPSTGMTFLLVEPGEFRKGIEGCERPRLCPYSPRPARIERPFYLAETEVAVLHWRSVLLHWKWKPSIPWTLHGPHGELLQRLYPDWPTIWRSDYVAMDAVSWVDAMNFGGALNERHGLRLDRHGAFRLPTGVEWEFACRAGTRTRYSFGDTLDRADAGVVPEVGEHGSGPDTVTGPPRNPWGFRGMHGNVAEWCVDLFHAFGCSEIHEFSPDSMEGEAVARSDRRRFDSLLRQTRGGNWLNSASMARSGVPAPMASSERIPGFGVRLVREIPWDAVSADRAEARRRQEAAALLDDLEATYGIAIRVHSGSTLTPESQGLWSEGLSLEKAQPFYGGIAEELDRYPIGFFEGTGLELWLRSAVYSRGTNVGGLFLNSENAVVLDLPVDPLGHTTLHYRRALHHELFHALEGSVLDKLQDYERWRALNAPDIAYRGFPRHGFDTPTGVRPTGFVSEYAQTNMTEDLAETFEVLISDRRRARELAAQDPIVAAKLDFLREQMPKLFGD